MEKSLKNLKRWNRKAAYDLGRKSLYYVVAIILIALIFAYVSNSINSHKIRSIDYLSSLSDLAYIEGLEKCMSQEDNGRIYLGRLETLDLNVNDVKNCLKENGLLENREFRITIEGEPLQGTSNEQSLKYDSYEKHFLFQNKIKKVKLEVEKIDKVYLYFK